MCPRAPAAMLKSSRGKRKDGAHASSDRGAEPAQDLRGHGGGRRCLLHRARGRDLRNSRPNGAGKTTTVECIEGLRAPDSGQISVLGLDPRHDRPELTQRLGVQLQDSQLPDQLRVAEALALNSAFYRNPADWHALMDTLGLTSKSKTPFGKLSGGQKQRLSIALA